MLADKTHGSKRSANSAGSDMKIPGLKMARGKNADTMSRKK